MPKIYLYDRQISLELVYKDPTLSRRESLEWSSGTAQYDISAKRTYVIDCPKDSMKPKISFSWKRVPQNFCYDVTITVSNLYLQLSSIWVDSIKIRAGYASHEAVFNCTVFNSYQNSPGPDGDTVFECIVAKAEIGSLAERAYSFEVYNNDPQTQEPWTIRDVLLMLQQKTGMRVVWHPGDFFNGDLRARDAHGYNWYLDRPFSTEDIPIQSFPSGYSLVADIQMRLRELFAPYEIDVTTILFNDAIHFIFMHKGVVTVYSDSAQDSQGSTDELVYELDPISSASWNAGILSVTAPWIPEIYPGVLIKIYPSYYTGSHSLPNLVAREELQRDTFDVYCVLTQECNFSTEGTNEMKLTAIPMKYSAVNNQSGSATDTKVPAEKMEELERIDSEVIELKLGSSAQLDAELKKIQSFKSLEDMSLEFSSGDVMRYKILEGDSLSTICNKYFNDKQLPTLTGKQNASSEPLSVPKYIAWFPIVMLTTYTAQKKSKTNDYKIDLKAPDSIVPGKYLIIPLNLSWSNIQQSQPVLKEKILKIYDLCSEYYKENGKTDWAKCFDTASYILRECKIQ